MAVTPQSQQVKDFWPHFKKAAVSILILFQLLSLAVTAAALYIFGIFENDIMAFGSVIAAQALLGIIASFIIFRFFTYPIKNLLAAIVHIAGERTITTPPNPNDRHFEKSGLKPALQTLYELAAKTTGDVATPVTSTDQPATGTPRTVIESALDATICGFVIMNQSRTITFANKATPVRIDQNGVHTLELLFNETDTLQQWWDECEKSAVNAEKTWARIANKLPNEEGRRFFDVIASYNKGTESEVVLTLVDRTLLYSVGEEELDFIAFAAHELRGPITVIRGYLDVLQDEMSDVLQDDQKELFRRLTVSANRLTGYINNILNTSKFDRRHLKMRLSENNLAAVYATIADDMQLRASSQNRLLSVAIPDGLPSIPADTASLGEVLSNLIDNAIKYSNEGGAIAVTAASKGDTIEVAIQDHGIGMPGNVVGNLFQKFYRSHRSRETVAGTGIGLYISKAIVESHGGSISVRSEEGKGSTFVVTLPTYQSVADKLKSGDNGNETLIKKTTSIENHSMYRG